MSDASEWVSQSEAARRLTSAGDTISQQQVSRYLERWPEIPRQEQANGQPMLVDFAALSAHRAENVRVQERAAQKDGEEADESATLRLRERRAQAERAEFELAKARGALIPRDAVLRGILAAGDALRETHRTSRFARAEALEATNDARAKAALLAEQDQAVEQAFAAALSACAEAEAADDDEEEEVTDAG